MLAATPFSSESTLPVKPVSVYASKKPIDWNEEEVKVVCTGCVVLAVNIWRPQAAKQEEEEPVEGDAALQRLFQKIYANGDDVFLLGFLDAFESISRDRTCAGR